VRGRSLDRFEDILPRRRQKDSMSGSEPVLVTGASGYIGGRLVDRLRALGVSVRAAGRRPEKLRQRWPGIEAVQTDVFRPETIRPATEGARVAYYLVHSMAEGETGFEQRDRTAAYNFAQAARDSGVETIVYLGGLGGEEDRLSPHLASRHETGRILAEHGPAVLEFRAGMVLGAGSASFRMLMDLVRRLPAMVTPRWVETRSQPIAIEDVLAYLQRAGDAPLAGHRIVEIGGADVLSYREMMRRVAAKGGRHPIIVPVPLLTPRLSSLWCGLVTSVPASIARPLIEGLRNETIVRDDAAARLFPDIHPIGFDQAVARAIREGTPTH
jgi:uncharacterized protein YbjT (DUF2867 family)